MLLFYDIQKLFFWLFENLITFIKLGCSLVSRQSSEYQVIEVRVSTLFSMCPDESCFGSICCFPLNYIKYFSRFSKLLSDGEIFDWKLLSKWYSEYGCSEVIVSTSFSMGPYENFLISSYFPSLKFINSSSSFLILWSDGEILACNFLSKLSSEDLCSEVIVSTSCWMGPDENFLDSSWYFSLNFINSSSFLPKLWS